MHTQLRQALWVEMASVVWMVIEAAVGVAAGVMVHAVSLEAFGIDSIIEWVAGVVLLWRLWVEARGAGEARLARTERVAAGVVGILLWLLGVWVVVTAGHHLWTRQEPGTSVAGIALAIASGLLMPILA